ncbi:hypothetical protein FLONG3_3842 [Fusarium longipes]|uniref:Uncharacterized protein n=1 Tax=Fusarium longipes TaxID=694270 RepID=A0A395T0G9_9HYPO|nr:hypothetical protein FLONG3_3842 [Fusarium longipes]
MGSFISSTRQKPDQVSSKRKLSSEDQTGLRPNKKACLDLVPEERKTITPEQHAALEAKSPTRRFKLLGSSMDNADTSLFSWTETRVDNMIEEQENTDHIDVFKVRQELTNEVQRLPEILHEKKQSLELEFAKQIKGCDGV